MGLCWCKPFKMCAFRTKENKQNGTRSRELSSKLQRFVQLFRPLFSQYFKVVGVFVVVVVVFFCLIKFIVILFNVTGRFRAKFANFVWLWGMMSVISLGIWSNISSGCAPEPTAWAHLILIFIVNFSFFVSLSHTFLVDSLVEMTYLTASPFRSNAAGLWW